MFRAAAFISALGLVHGQSSYRAAVVEFAPQLAVGMNATVEEAQRHLISNVAAFEPFVEEAKGKGVQIIVFPEYGVVGDGTQKGDWDYHGITNFSEPVPEPSPTPLCTGGVTSYGATMRAACMAKKYGITLAFNLVDQQGGKQYNTAVVVDEEGRVIAKYHKRHLYGSEGTYLDKGASTNGTRFTASFGVEFGMMICFDILFESAEHIGGGRKHFVFPTDWVNIVPFFHALSEQERWSHVHQVTLLASNYGGFGKEASGSGIWHQGTALAKFYNPTKKAESEMLIADVPL